MKWTARLLTSAFVITTSAAPAASLGITAGFASAISDAVDASTAHTNRAALLTAADFAISKIDKQMVDAFRQAWMRSGNGSQPQEGVVLILRMTDGGYTARELGSTNEHKQFTFRWHPGTIAIVHTHPNTSDPKPQDEDIDLANKRRVPIFTITSRGMYVYDPGARKLSKVMSDLDWLDVAHWNKGLFAKH